MERGEALARMQEIQRIMERTTLYTHLPGTPAVIGGALALAGCGLSYASIRSFDFEQVALLPMSGQIAFCMMWAVIAVVAVVQDVFLTARAARRLEVEPVGRPGQLAAFSLTPSVLAAAVLTVQFLLDAQVKYVAPVWIMCYGVGVYAAGLFSVRLTRVLGMAFLLVGGFGLLFFSRFGVLLVAASFGLLHILFGIAVIRRARRIDRQ